MATFRSSSPRRYAGSAEGVAFAGSDSITPTAGATNDVYRFGPFPAGVRVHRVNMKNADLDSNGSPTIVFKAGFSHVDGSSVANTVAGQSGYPADASVAFAAAGQTTLQAAAAETRYFIKPIEIVKDWFLDLVLGTGSATFASGEITIVVEGEGVGQK